jgi:hypothetical protein
VSTFDPAARDKGPGPLSILFGLLTLLAIIACVAGLIIGVPIAQQYPAKVTVPTKVLGLDLLAQESRSAPALSGTGVALGKVGNRPLVVGVYADAKGSSQLIVLTKAQFLMFPESELDRVLSAVSGGTDEVGEIVEVPAGDLGGTAKCAYFRFEEFGKRRGVLCGWADHGSIGIVGLAPAEDRDEAARKMLDVRFAVETH